MVRSCCWQFPTTALWHHRLGHLSQREDQDVQQPSPPRGVCQLQIQDLGDFTEDMSTWSMVKEQAHRQTAPWRVQKHAPGRKPGPSSREPSTTCGLTCSTISCMEEDTGTSATVTLSVGGLVHVAPNSPLRHCQPNSRALSRRRPVRRFLVRCGAVEESAQPRRFLANFEEKRTSSSPFCKTARRTSKSSP